MQAMSAHRAGLFLVLMSSLATTTFADTIIMCERFSDAAARRWHDGSPKGEAVNPDCVSRPAVGVSTAVAERAGFVPGEAVDIVITMEPEDIACEFLSAFALRQTYPEAWQFVAVVNADGGASGAIVDEEARLLEIFWVTPPFDVTAPSAISVTLRYQTPLGGIAPATMSTQTVTLYDTEEEIIGGPFVQVIDAVAPEGEGDGEITGDGEGEGQPEGAGEGSEEGEDATVTIHTADQDSDGVISLSELLRIIQFFNEDGLHCSARPGDTEDGFSPGPDANAQACLPHASDYDPQDWSIRLSELLRLVQFFNSGGYFPCTEGEDGFCPSSH